jgi:hypothetical protein
VTMAANQTCVCRAGTCGRESSARRQPRRCVAPSGLHRQVEIKVGGRVSCNLRLWSVVLLFRGDGMWQVRWSRTTGALPYRLMRAGCRPFDVL